MLVALEPVTKKKTKLYLDEELKGVLYPQDLRNYHITEGAELSETAWETLYQEVILHRAKQKAMALLVRMDYSECGMRRKLRSAFYCAQAIEDTISFLYSYHYLDDERFAQQYMITKGASMGRGEICRRLRAQGIAEDIILRVYEEMEVTDTDVLQAQMRKKLAGRTQLDEKERRRILSYFLRRGFAYGQVVDAMRCYVQNVDFSMGDFSEQNG